MITKHFNGLTEAEAERLAILIEECGEAVQSACKILRHGYRSTNPKIIGSETNREALTRELGDLMTAIFILTDAKDIDGDLVRDYAESKSESIKPWLHHQEV